MVKGIGTSIENLIVQLLIGGNSTDEDIKKLKQTPPHIIVGCPGRIHDMMKKKYIDTKTIKLTVLE